MSKIILEDRLIRMLVGQIVTSSLENLWKVDGEWATTYSAIVKSNVSIAAISGATVIACALYDGDDEQYARIVKDIKKRIYEELNEKEN